MYFNCQVILKHTQMHATKKSDIIAKKANNFAIDTSDCILSINYSYVIYEFGWSLCFILCYIE